MFSTRQHRTGHRSIERPCSRRFNSGTPPPDVRATTVNRSAAAGTGPGDHARSRRPWGAAVGHRQGSRRHPAHPLRRLASAAFSPDGRTLATTDDDGVVETVGHLHRHTTCSLRRTGHDRLRRSSAGTAPPSSPPTATAPHTYGASISPTRPGSGCHLPQPHDRREPQRRPPNRRVPRADVHGDALTTYAASVGPRVCEGAARADTSLRSPGDSER